MRVNEKERKNNARHWYSCLINSYNSKSAVVVHLCEDAPNINRIQLLACNAIGTPVVIAESEDGISGCMRELLQNINPSTTAKDYFDDDFKEWLLENYHLYLTYNDGMVLMFEREAGKSLE